MPHFFAPWGHGRRTPSQLREAGPAPRDPAPGPYLRVPAPVCGPRYPSSRYRSPALRLPLLSALLPPATRGAPWLRRAALANQRCRPRPSLAPQPMSVPVTGHRPRGGGEGGAGAESGLRGRKSRGPGGGTARAEAKDRGCGRGRRSRTPSSRRGARL